MRRGFTIVEMIVTMMILGALAAAVVPTLRWVNLQRTETERRLIAQQEAGNLLERAATVPWNELGPETGKDWPLSPEGVAALPGGRVVVSVQEEAGASPATKAVRVEVHWTSSVRRSEAPVQVTAWFARPAEGNP